MVAYLDDELKKIENSKSQKGINSTKSLLDSDKLLSVNSDEKFKVYKLKEKSYKKYLLIY